MSLVPGEIWTNVCLWENLGNEGVRNTSQLTTHKIEGEGDRGKQCDGALLCHEHWKKMSVWPIVNSAYAMMSLTREGGKPTAPNTWDTLKGKVDIEALRLLAATMIIPMLVPDKHETVLKGIVVLSNCIFMAKHFEFLGVSFTYKCNPYWRPKNLMEDLQQLTIQRGNNFVFFVAPVSWQALRTAIDAHEASAKVLAAEQAKYKAKVTELEGALQQGAEEIVRLNDLIKNGGGAAGAIDANDLAVAVKEARDAKAELQKVKGELKKAESEIARLKKLIANVSANTLAAINTRMAQWKTRFTSPSVAQESKHVLAIVEVLAPVLQNIVRMSKGWTEEYAKEFLAAFPSYDVNADFDANVIDLEKALKGFFKELPGASRIERIRNWLSAPFQAAWGGLKRAAASARHGLDTKAVEVTWVQSWMAAQKRLFLAPYRTISGKSWYSKAFGGLSTIVMAPLYFAGSALATLVDIPWMFFGSGNTPLRKFGLEEILASMKAAAEPDKLDGLPAGMSDDEKADFSRAVTKLATLQSTVNADSALATMDKEHLLRIALKWLNAVGLNSTSFVDWYDSEFPDHPCGLASNAI